MMHLQINKKIFIYIFFFVLFGSLNNKFLLEFRLNEIKEIDILGLGEIEKNKLLKSLSSLDLKNIFYLKETEIRERIDANNIVENYTIKKRYPFSLEIQINQTKFLANFYNENEIFFVGSNGKLIKTNNRKEELPTIFGQYDAKSFFHLFNVIEDSNFDLKRIKNLYFFKSGRWDIETNAGMLIKLPGQNLQEKLNLSSKILNSNNFDEIKILDLRQKNQVIINGK